MAGLQVALETSRQAGCARHAVISHHPEVIKAGSQRHVRRCVFVKVEFKLRIIQLATRLYMLDTMAQFSVDPWQQRQHPASLGYLNMTDPALNRKRVAIQHRGAKTGFRPHLDLIPQQAEFLHFQCPAMRLRPQAETARQCIDRVGDIRLITLCYPGACHINRTGAPQQFPVANTGPDFQVNIALCHITKRLYPAGYGRQVKIFCP